MKPPPNAMCAAVAACVALTVSAPLARAEEAKNLSIGVVQFGLESTLEQNSTKVVRLIRQAAATGARLVVFPEGALAAPHGTGPAEHARALEAVRRAAEQNKVYVAVGTQFVPADRAKTHNQLHVFDPQGNTLLVYDKVWYARTHDVPKMVSIHGVPCSFILCADRWSRPVEALPPVLGAKIVIECSANFDTEWLPALEWYWYIPRALRNTTFVVLANTAPDNRLPGGSYGHGHSVVIDPTGKILAAAGGERDTIIRADLDLSKATRAMAIRRSRHPLFRAWWQMGEAIYNGKDFSAPDVPSLVSSAHSVKCGFAHMSLSPSIYQNVQTIADHLKQAASTKVDLVVFPELALTGPREEDVKKADAQTLAAALETVRQTVKRYKLTAVVGAPSFVNGKRRNSAYTIGPDGSILTRYDQIVVGRPNLFQGGMSTKAMWFQVNGVWAHLTIGDDALWTEMAELAALRGARLHCHLTTRHNMTPAEALLHDQIMANLASFRTLTVVGSPLRSGAESGHARFVRSAAGVWDDLEAGNWCAVKIQNGKPWEKVFCAPRIVPGSTNPLRHSGYWLRTTPRYRPWMLAGMAAMDLDIDTPSARTD
ncbi:MAG: carbon-nitrogen hydrolase family protein [Thermoguttaceae bacterium]